MYKLSKRLVTCSATTNMSVQHDTKRKKWTFDEDIVLLRQVSADLPFEASHGTIGSNWESVARTLTSCSTFGRNVNGKKCQNRFNILLDEHKILRQEAMKASGASEDETEKTQLLDDLLLRMQETEEKSVKASIAASAANRSKDLNAHHEMEYLVDMLRVESEKQLEFEKFKFEKEMQDRQAEREARLELA
ncbi:hypothetical protein DYB38_012569, partial [Aphanomyces astaci]